MSWMTIKSELDKRKREPKKKNEDGETKCETNECEPFSIHIYMYDSTPLAPSAHTNLQF